MPRKQRHERLAIELKTWLRQQGRFRSVREVADAVKIPYTSVKDYFNGRAVPAGERRRLLFELTKAPTLREGDVTAPRKDSGPNRNGTTGQVSKSPVAADDVLLAIHTLIARLERFKKGTPADRDVLRAMVPKRDVGYLTTLLRALYDEDEFQTWLYFTEYQPPSR